MLNRKKKIKFSKFKTDVPIIKFELTNGSSHFGIVDTGSESTIISKKLVADNSDVFMSSQNKDMALVGMFNNSNVTVTETSAIFCFGGERKIISGITADLTALNEQVKECCDKDICVSVVFGCDTLKAISAIIDFGDESIKMQL